MADTRTDLPDDLHAELLSLVRGNVYKQSDPEYTDIAKMFNGNVVPLVRAITQPLDAQDVSRILMFCNGRSLSPSVKSGGYGTAGWAVGGDVLIDLSMIGYIEMNVPLPDGGYKSLRDTSDAGTTNSTERQPQGDDGASSGKTTLTTTGAVKRPRSPGTPEVDSELPRDPVVARFLRGDLEQGPSVRRKLDEGASAGISSERAEGATAAASDEEKEPWEAAPGPPPSTTQATTRTTSTPTQTRSIFERSAAAASFIRPPTTSSTSSRPLAHATGPPTTATHAPYTSTNTTSSIDPFGYMSTSSSSLHTDSSPFSYMSSSVGTSSTAHSTYAQPVYRTDPGGVELNISASASASSNGGGGVTINPHSGDTGGNGRSNSYLASTATPLHPHAYVSFGAGVKQKHIDLFTAARPLPATDIRGERCEVPYHVPLAAHPAGSSVLLLGGFGFLSRLHGLCSDALVEVEIVLADGQVLIVNEREHAELWWALRGAGSTIGIVTRYIAKAYPVPIVYAGNLIYPFHPPTAPSLLTHVRDCLKGAPRELYANMILTAGPASKGNLIVIQICWIGTREKGAEWVQAISSWNGGGNGGGCLLNEVGEKRFLDQQNSVAQVLRGKAGRQWFIRSTLINSLPDDIIHKSILQFAGAPTGCTWLFELASGAPADAHHATTSCIPQTHREATWTIAAFHQWEMGDDDPRCVESAEEWITGTLTTVGAGGALPSFFGRNEDPQRVISSFGENWSRLCGIKRQYDPEALFRNNFWPLSKDGDVVEASGHEPPSP